MDNLILQKAKLKLLEIENQKPPDKENPKERTDSYLLKALGDLENCTERMQGDIDNLLQEIKEIKIGKDFDKHWETRIKYCEYQIEVIKKTYPEYERIAKVRLAHYWKIQRENRWNKEKELCAEDTHYWYKWWAWTADPRVTGLWALPFIPYDFQKEAIDSLEKHMFVKKSDLLFEKSRDMGFSWILVATLYKHWQHRPGGFQALIGSMTIDDTDVVGNPSTLFEKIRTLSNLQPKGLLPSGFKGDIPYVKCINPENGNAIVGEPCNKTFGRGGRYTVIVMDELSAVEQDTEALTACSQSSPCRIYNATVRGMGNEFAQLRHSGAIPVYTFHWTQHPHRDARWYEFQKLQLNSDTRVAQELDIDYSASTPNRVYPEWNEVYHVVTKSEVMRALPKFRNSDGKFYIPLGHNIAMGEDVSMSDGCKHVLLWFVTLREGSVTIDGQDLSGSVLCYREVVMPPKSTPRRTALRIKAEEDFYEKRMIMDRLISHEATTEREIYEDEHGLIFRHWKTDYWEGISRVRDYLEIQGNEPHPFRDHSRYLNWGDKAPEIIGTPRIFFVVDDPYGELKYEPSTKRFSVSQPKNFEDGSLWRIRAEMPVYHFPTEELGKEVLKMRPKKIMDDACFIAGTKIETLYGSVPIEDIKIGDLVLTRDGYKQVLDCGLTNLSAEVFRIEFENGHLEGTKNHPIFNGVEFVPMDMLRCGDRVTTLEDTQWKYLEEKEKLKKLNSTELFIEDTQNQNVSRTELITGAEVQTRKRDIHIYTEIYGNSTMEKYQKVITYTIKTITLRTIISLILFVLVLRNTLKNTKADLCRKNRSYILRVLENLLLYGINLQKEENGTEKWLETESIKSRNTPASFAKKSSQAKNPQESIFAPNLVKKNATAVGKKPVYNLTVKDSHEYFANGILVHNCDVLRCTASEFFAPISKLTIHERAENSLPHRLTGDSIEAMSPRDKEIALIQRIEYIRKYIASEQNLNKSWRDQIYDKAYGR